MSSSSSKQTSIPGAESQRWGYDNTTAILTVDANAPAAKACADYGNSTSYDDWYLPSLVELGMMYDKKAIFTGSSSFDTTTNFNYWSSTQDGSDPNNKAWKQNFYSGTQWARAKSTAYSVRAIRAF